MNELQTIEYEVKGSSYQVKDYEEKVQECLNFIAKYSHDIVIMNDEDKKSVKEARTEIRKKLDSVKRYRIDFNTSVMGKFNDQMKTIESALDEADKKLKKRLDDYEAMTKDEEQTDTVYSIIVSSLDKDAIEKVSAYAKKLKCKVK